MLALTIHPQRQLITAEGEGRIADIILAVFFKPGGLGLHPDAVALALLSVARSLCRQRS